MGRMLGYYDSDELDRPELNKCPDCECYFATEECPLCGKICPEEMRAGNRAPVKHKKRRNSSGRVQFVAWYHSWWFILIMMFTFTIAGVVLLISSPHSKRLKIIGCAIVAVVVILSSSFMGQTVWDMIFSEPLVNDGITQDEYEDACANMSVEAFYRAGDSTEGQYITMTLKVAERFTDWYTAYDEEPALYYLCYEEGNPEVQILVRDCLIGKDFNFKAGDTVTVFGESGGQVKVAKDGTSADLIYPCLYMAYAEMTSSAHKPSETQADTSDETTQPAEVAPLKAS